MIIKFKKIFYCLLMTGFSLHIFILNPLIQEDIKYNNPIKKFMFEIFYSTNNFDIIWITSSIFLYYFYYNNFLFKNDLTKEKIFILLISFFLSLPILIYISIINYGSLIMLINSPAQIFKSIMLIFGYSIIISTIIYKIKNKINNVT